MTTKHTPGPWHFFRQGMSHFVSQACDEDFRFVIATVHEQNYHPDGITSNRAEAEANAQLIAAAPDLLAECERLRAINAQLRVSLEWAIGHIDGSPSLSHKACLTAIRAVVDRAKGPQS